MKKGECNSLAKLHSTLLDAIGHSDFSNVVQWDNCMLRRRLILSLRDPSRLPPKYANINLDVLHGDYNNPNTLLTAFHGASKLLLISYPSIAYSTRVAAHRNAIDATRSAGIHHIYYTCLAFSASGIPPPTSSTAAVMSAHHATESYLKSVCALSDGLVTYTIIREGIYAAS
jgi:uncharacterized protein YbjT (DUF2867 family)